MSKNNCYMIALVCGVIVLLWWTGSLPMSFALIAMFAFPVGTVFAIAGLFKK